MATAKKTATKKKVVNYTDIMVDLETLGTVADSVMLSIGAVRFNKVTGNVDDAGFYACVDVDDQLKQGRRIQSDTLQWWLGQDAAAKKALFTHTLTLNEALAELINWMGDAEKMEVWSNGADFDLPILHHAVRTQDLELPVKFWNHRCMRTMKKLPGADAVGREFSGTRHHALDDASNQAQHLSAIWNHLFGAK
jgi:hypothetical protein